MRSDNARPGFLSLHRNVTKLGEIPAKRARSMRRLSGCFAKKRASGDIREFYHRCKFDRKPFAPLRASPRPVGVDNCTMGKVRSNPKLRRPIFLREWREHRNMTLEQVAEAMNITAGAISQVELGKNNYTRAMLEFLADLYNCTPADLLMRNPLDTEAPWSIWDQAKPAQRQQIISMMKIIVGDKNGTHD